MQFFAVPPIDPIAFKIGDLTVQWYGILIFFGFMIAIVLVILKLKLWYKVPIEPFYWFCFIGIPVSILGARTWSFVIGDATVNQGSNFFYDFWQFQTGGLAIQGGIIATFIAALIYFPLILKRNKYLVRTRFNGKDEVKIISTFVYADVVIPAVLIGQAIGRWGNMFNQEVYGWAVTNPHDSFAWLEFLAPKVFEQMIIDDHFRQPLFLYESFSNVILFLIIWVGLEFYHKRKAGDLAAGYFIGYGVIRLIMESLRDTKFDFIGSYVMTSIMILIGISFIIINNTYLYKKRDTKILYRNLIFLKLYFRKIKYKFNSQYKIYIDKNDPGFKNFGENEKISFKRKKLLYYNGL